MYYTCLETPIGVLLLAGEGGALREIRFPKNGRAASPEVGWRESSAELDSAIRQLTEYFAGGRRKFDLRLELDGTEFQRAVWQEVARIPYGETRSYGDIARAIGRPSACRAVGAANGRNPIPIVIPCHRVIGSDRRLTGFGGGLDIKEALLALEQNRNWRR